MASWQVIVIVLMPDGWLYVIRKKDNEWVSKFDYNINKLLVKTREGNKYPGEWVAGRGCPLSADQQQDVTSYL